jgi:hypothetical protein
MRSYVIGSGHTRLGKRAAATGMKVVRFVSIVTLAALGPHALASGITSNGTGDGEANVPFASSPQEERVLVFGCGTVEPWAMASEGSANVPFAASPVRDCGEDVGAGGREFRATLSPSEEAERANRHAEWTALFEQQVWTGP